MDKIFESFVKFILILLLAPVVFALAAQLALGIFAAALPWLIALSVVAGLTAGLSAGLVMRRRLPPRWDVRVLPPGTHPRAYRVRRERGFRE